MKFFYQNLAVLNLESNQIGETGAVYLSDGLRNNTVKKYIHIIY